MILVINAGSSNFKFALYDQDLRLAYKATVSSVSEIYETIQKGNYKIIGIGHRLILGGTKYYDPVILDPAVIKDLQGYSDLMPLHQPKIIESILHLQTIYPNVMQVACFDTGFHKTQLELHKLFAIPTEYRDSGVIRYGYHGLSYQYIASKLDQYLSSTAQEKVIVAHLGNGASMCAMQNKQSVATSMGFSALDGLMMGTRPGNIDPGVLLYLLQHRKFSNQQLSDLLYKQSGLLGVSELSNDVRILCESDTVNSQLAIDLFCYRAATNFCALLAALQGCNSLVFTAGIGEHSAIIRSKICKWLTWLGIKLDSNANDTHANIISTTDSKITVAVIPTDEEFIIAKETRSLLSLN